MRLDRDRLDRRGERQPTISFSDDQARLVCEPCVPDDDSAKHTHTHHFQKDLSDLLRDIREKGNNFLATLKSTRQLVFTLAVRFPPLPGNRTD